MPYCPTILLPVMTTVSEEVPQGAPTLVRTHAPSRLPPPLPPPPLFRDARRGSSASGLLRRVGFEGSAARGVSREPDSDFSSLPMLPPALPCARARPGKATLASVADSRAALARYRIIFCIICWFPMNRVLAVGPSALHGDGAARVAGVAARVNRRDPRPLDGDQARPRIICARAARSKPMLANNEVAGTRIMGAGTQSSRADGEYQAKAVS